MNKNDEIYIYCYQNRVNGKVYIGRTSTLRKRDRDHTLYQAPYMAIDRAIKKYGRDQFDFWVVDICQTPEEADEYEITMIANMRKEFGKDNVYNISDGGKPAMRGRKHTEATKAKIRAKRLGTKASDETKAIMSIAQLERQKKYPTTKWNHSEAWKKLMSEKMTGRQMTDEWKQKIGRAHIGRRKPPLSEETKKKMSEAQKRRWEAARQQKENI